VSGIAGIEQNGRQEIVEKMLDKISHRGNAGCKVKEVEGATFGVVWTETQKDSLIRMKQNNEAYDGDGAGHSALAKIKDKGIVLKRDPLGVVPLYYGEDDKGMLCFASEVKALLDICSEVNIVPPGHRFDGEDLKPYFKLKKRHSFDKKPDNIAKGLKKKIVNSIKKRIDFNSEVGAWLSGGLDSSALSALARPLKSRFFTFTAGVEGSTDIEHAREVADFIDSEHHEIIVEFSDLLQILPTVIYHLESFDALLVRSSLMNYIVAKEASEYVSQVTSGEGGDELFAGYHYLKELNPDAIPDELIDITRRLHNTALQRVDRSAAAHGTVAHVCFLDPEVVEYVLRIPSEFKLRDDVEKWILRLALEGELPEKVLNREKAKFWKGAGVEELLLEYAEKEITDDDFRRERILKNGWQLRSKEELLYYRFFKEHFGDLEELAWMGRTKKVPSIQVKV
jgi:asparagine synthase (glutamine-hydrolysing)